MPRARKYSATLVAVDATHYGPMALGYDRYTGDPKGTIGALANTAPGSYEKTFHFVLNNTMTHDNRIPPYGMDCDEARKRNALPVPSNQYGGPADLSPGDSCNGVAYRYWDEVPLSPPDGAVGATIDLLYQSTSWEYIQFLDLANDGSVISLADEGQVMLEAWLNTGMSAPYVMASATWGSPPVIPAPPPDIPPGPQCSQIMDEDSCDRTSECTWDDDQCQLR